MTPRLELIHLTATTARGKRPALLFVHGAFCGAWCWHATFMPWFAAEGYDSWAMSLEGHAGSEGRDYLAAISIEDYRHNLAQILSQLPSPTVVIAHSMGAYVVQQFLQKDPLPAVALLAPVAASGMATASLRLLSQAPELFFKLNLYQQGYYQPPRAELRQLLFSSQVSEPPLDLLLAHCQPESQRAVMDMALANTLWRRPGYKPPALVLGAAEDLMIPRQDVIRAAQMLGVEAEFVPESGHMMMLDAQWQDCAQRIADWLASLKLGEP